MSNTTPNFNLRSFIDSLMKNEEITHEPLAPHALVNMSHLVTPLRVITKEGRALNSTEEYSVGQLIGNVLNAYISAEPTEQQKDECIAGLSLLVALLMRSVPASQPDTTIEEFLIDATSQDELIKLARLFSAAPASINDKGSLVPDFAQFPIFHNPLELTDAAIDGFIQRRIAAPLEDAPSYEEVNEMMKSARIVKLSDLDLDGQELIADALNGFDEFYEIYFKSQNGETDDEY
jgi:hypothetical protein